MASKRIYITLELSIDTYGNATNKDIQRAANRYISAGEKDHGNVYIQNANTVAIIDENGQNVITD